MNKSKAKGTAAETAVVRWARANGFPGADRQPLRGNRDAGDIGLCPGVVLEVKNHAGVASLGQPARSQLADWMAQAEQERVNAGAAYCPLVVKRSGTAMVGQWFAYLPTWAFASLVVAPIAYLPDPAAPWCINLHHLGRLLRWAGYGDRLDDAKAAS